MIDRQCQRRHANAIGRRADKGLRTFLLNNLRDILAGKTKQHKQAALAAAKR